MNDIAPTSKPGIHEDILAILCAGLLILISLVPTWALSSVNASGKFETSNPLSHYVGKPAKWNQSPVDAFAKRSESGQWQLAPLVQVAGTWVLLGLVLCLAGLLSGRFGGIPFLLPFAAIFLLATLAYIFSGNEVAKAYNLEYALWALAIGMAIANTVGTPSWLKPAVQSEFYIKTGLVLLGVEVLISKLMALGIPGIFVAWVVTPIVLVTTYWFGQNVLKLKSKSLNMVISADMSVCGVSAAIAAAAATRAKKEELSLAIGMSLSFTVIMMVVLPLVIKLLGLDPYVGGAWLGGTIDSTGAVVAAGGVLGDEAAQVAATVKMIQNILIGVAAFCIATYWVARVEPAEQGAEAGRKVGISEIWLRFPKFILGFVGASILFSLLHAGLSHGPELVDAVIQGSTKSFRGWLFCLAFVSIGLQTRFGDFAEHLRGGKPVLLYVCGQTLNLLLTLLMAYLMFGILFKDSLGQ